MNPRLSPCFEGTFSCSYGTPEWMKTYPPAVENLPDGRESLHNYSSQKWTWQKVLQNPSFFSYIQVVCSGDDGQVVAVDHFFIRHVTENSSDLVGFFAGNFPNISRVIICESTGELVPMGID